MRLWRPYTTGVLIAGIVIVILAAAIAFMITTFHPTTDVRMGSGLFKAKIADDEGERARGLSGVSTLDPSEALLMVFDSDDTWGIWMKDMKVSLDILWLDSDKKVVYVVKNASPELSTDKTFKPNDPARYVIEVPAGTVEANGIKIGETVIFVLDGEKE